MIADPQTNKLINNKYTKDNNRYIIEYYINLLQKNTKKEKQKELIFK